MRDRLEKARRGELAVALPSGYVRAEDGHALLDPDASVQAAIHLVFERFQVLGTAQKVVCFFHEQGLRLPRRHTSGAFAGQLLWREATETAVTHILRHPAYAGIYTCGRRSATGPPLGAARPRRTMPRREWQVVIPGVYPAYISTEEWEANRERLRQNAARFDAQCGPGPALEGRAILTGIVRCGHLWSSESRHLPKCAPVLLRRAQALSGGDELSIRTWGRHRCRCARCLLRGAAPRIAGPTGATALGAHGHGVRHRSPVAAAFGARALRSPPGRAPLPSCGRGEPPRGDESGARLECGLGRA
jgi:hypothetical protein